MPQVSVIIPTYNHARFVSEAVQSALEQTFQDREIIVVDDGSTDDTRKVLAYFGSSIRYIYQENKGLSAARNTGIRAAEGEYIALLDADDLWLPAKMERQMAVFAARPEVDLVYTGDIIFDHDSGIILAERCYEGVIKPEGLILQNVFYPSSVVVRREVLQRVGLFDEALSGAADWDMWLRLAGAGCYFACASGSLLKYRIYETNMHKNIPLMEADKLAVLGKFFARQDLPAHIRALKNHAYSNVYAHTGAQYYALRQMSKARANLLRAIVLRPSVVFKRPEVPLLILKSLLGARLLALGKRWKRKISELIST